MRLSLFVGLWFDERQTVSDAVETIVDAERRGIDGVWMAQISGFDAMTVLALAAARTERILLGTSVVPTWPRHPIVMAQQALTVAQISAGRFRLGIGTSHVPIIRDMYGIEFEKPIRHVREYLEIVKSLTTQGSVEFEGEQYRVDMDLEIPDPRMPVMISVLSEQMIRAAGRYADGAITWLAPPSYIASTVVPLVREAAAAARRTPPPVIAQVPVTCSDASADVRQAVRRYLDAYPRFPFYNAMLVSAGVPDAIAALEEGWTDELIDAVVAHGDWRVLGEWVQAYRDAGVHEVVFAPVPTGDDRRASVNGTLDAIERLTSN